jgi:hypothetical protein
LYLTSRYTIIPLQRLHLVAQYILSAIPNLAEHGKASGGRTRKRAAR